MAYLFLALAIVGELLGTSMLKASVGFTKLIPSIVTAVSFLGSFYFLSLSLKDLSLNMTYATWSGLGAVLTTVISVAIWKEKINGASIAGIVLIVAGVVVLNLFGPGHGSSDEEATKTHVTQNV